MCPTNFGAIANWHITLKAFGIDSFKGEELLKGEIFSFFKFVI